MGEAEKRVPVIAGNNHGNGPPGLYVGRHARRPTRLRARRHGGRLPRFALVVVPLLAIFAMLAIFATATPTSAADGPETTSQAARLAGHLRAHPVYVTDQLPRAVPRSTAPEFADLARRTGVPTYVLVLPGQGSDGEQLLAAVHDRLGRDGLYVLVDDMGVGDAAAYGVRAPADAAKTVALYELPYDAGALASFERFADVVAQGPEKAAERAEAAREKYGGDAAAEPEKRYVSATDRDNQSFLTGILLAGVPLLIVLTVPYVRRLRRLHTSTAPLKGGRAKRGLRPPETALAAVAALAVALGALALCDQTKSDAAPPPTAADLSARVDRVAAGLGRDPLYTDPESPNVLGSGDEADQLRTKVRQLQNNVGPVYVAVVPSITEDESAGEAETFLNLVANKTGKDGVYVAADPLGGDIDVVDHGLRLDTDRISFGLPDSVRYGDDEARAADRAVDHDLARRLDALMTFLDKTQRPTDGDEAPASEAPASEASASGAPASEAPAFEAPASRAPAPIEETALRPLFSGDFWPGLMVGAIAAVLVFGVLAALLGIARRTLPGLRRHPGAASRTPPSPSPSTSDFDFDAPPNPSPDYLRHTAHAELVALSREFEAETTSTAPPHIRTRVWDLLDAALLLADRGRAPEPEPAPDRAPDGHIDDDTAPADNDPTAPADFAAAITLARSARALLAGVDKPPCALNPLHGPAAAWRDVRYAPDDRRRRTLPVCAPCRTAVEALPDAAHALRLTVPGPPGPGGSARVPYDRAPGPLSAARRGIPQLIRQAREYAGVDAD